MYVSQFSHFFQTPVERRVDDVLSQSSEKSMDSLTDNDLLPQHQPNNMSSNFQVMIMMTNLFYEYSSIQDEAPFSQNF